MASPDTPATFETFQAELARLVAQFDRQHPTYTAPDYLEANLRSEFLDAFFRALGWDVGNQKGLIHTEREVDIEVRTTMSGRQTRADYVFRLNRTERFTCEAKKPAEVLHDRHIFQAKRDAFARGVPLAILSDFEEMKLFIVGARPHLDDPHTGEWKVLHFKQYNDAASELWDLLGYESVKSGSIDRLIDSLPKRPLRLKGRQGYLIKPDRTRALDADFLNFLDDVRQQLGSDLLKHNDRADLLEGHRLNEAAQRIIDRLVFLRICEDRGIDTGTLLQTLFDGWYRQQPDAAKPKLRKPGKQTHMRFGGALEEEPPPGHGARVRTEGGLYRELTDHIRALDQRPPSYKPFFNGQLFKPHFSEELTVGDEWLANFLLDLVDDDTGYNFADIKVEILGDAYERFLGKILRPQGRGATIEEKPEVRKAGGVYYTPRYITDYIVEQTLGRLLEGKPPKQVEKLRIVDPACGSGSFLLRAYELVMEHHLRWFTANPDKQRKEDCYVDAAKNVRLTTALKRRILENNIYGVDIDAQAVEVTQLSLYLKMLEGENRETLRTQTELFREQPLLPPLDRNIKCFNSLIASDFSLDPAELVRVNAGDWDVQFPDIMQAGGFDAVIGNPPYGAELSDHDSDYLRAKYKCAEYQIDTYPLFAELAEKLLKAAGNFGMIVPSAWVASEYNRQLRTLLSSSLIPLTIVVAPKNVFADATVETLLVIAAKQSRQKSSGFPVERWDIEPRENYIIDLARITGDEALLFPVYRNPEIDRLIQKLSVGNSAIRASCDAVWGVKVYQKGKGKPPQKGMESDTRCFHAQTQSKPTHQKLLGGSEVCRYNLSWAGQWIDYGPWLAEPRTPDWFQGSRILIREVTAAGKIQAVSTNEPMVFSNSVDGLRLREGAKFPLKFLLGILNSQLLSFYNLNTSANAFKGAFPKVLIKDLLAFPIPKDCPSDLQNKLVALVDKMLTLTPALRTAKSDAEKTTLQNALTKTDREIDQLVYQLYGLTPEEISLVEGTGNPAAAGAAD